MATKIKLSKSELLTFSLIGLSLCFTPFLFTRDWGFVEFEDIGDTVGGVTAPFLSFFGSILVYLALKSQVNANKKVNRQFKIQQVRENEQSFENSFFNLLNYHLNIVNTLEKLYDRSKIRRTKQIYLSGDDKEFIAKSKLVFEIEFNKLSQYLANEYFEEARYLEDFDELNLKQNEDRLTIFKKIYTSYYSQEVDIQFGNYFRNLYRLIRTIDNHKFHTCKKKDFLKKYYYTTIVRAQFSDIELKWIFFNGLSNFGEKFKPLIERYSLLKNANIHDEILENYSKYYDISAFNSSTK